MKSIKEENVSSQADESEFERDYASFLNANLKKS